MTSAEWKEQVGAYVLGILDGEEHRAFAAFLTDGADDSCRAELTRMQDVVRTLDKALPRPRSSVALWARIEGGLPASERPPTTMAEARVRRRKREAIAWSLAVAAALVVLWFWNHERAVDSRVDAAHAQVMQIAKERDDTRVRSIQCAGDLERLRVEQRNDESRALVGALGRADTVVVPFAAAGDEGKGLEARWVFDPGHNQAWVVGAGFTPHPGQTYQLWTIRGKSAATAAGLATVDADGHLIARFTVASLAGSPPDAVAVSLEKNTTDDKPELVLIVARRS